MDKELKKKILDLMITARCLEERMVKMSKSEDGFFWLGGPGEEAFNVPLGLLARRRPDKDQEPDHNPLDYDYFHFHYRNAATMLAMDMEPKDELRQMNNRATDPFSAGRNFSNHFARPEWNVVPVTSTIQTQCVTAPGSALAQKRHGGKGLTILTFGDAGTAEGDFHIGLNWATQPVHKIRGCEGMEPGIPLLFICTNNLYGISTDYSDVHGQSNITEIAAGYGMPTKVIDGKNVEESYAAIEEAMDYVREHRKPYFLEAMVSRLRGHSSSSGANQVPVVDNKKDYVPGKNEIDPILVWVKKLVKQKVVAKDYFEYLPKEKNPKEKEYSGKQYEKVTKEMTRLLAEVKQEAEPKGEMIYDHIFKQEIGDPRDYE